MISKLSRRFFFAYSTTNYIQFFSTSNRVHGGFGRNIGDWARRVVNGLSETERTMLMQELSKHKTSTKPASVSQETVSRLNAAHIRLI